MARRGVASGEMRIAFTAMGTLMRSLHVIRDPVQRLSLIFYSLIHVADFVWDAPFIPRNELYVDIDEVRDVLCGMF